jgi:hypothetical protein
MIMISMDALAAARVFSLRVQARGELLPLIDNPAGPTITTAALARAAMEKRVDIAIPAQPAKTSKTLAGDEVHQR